MKRTIINFIYNFYCKIYNCYACCSSKGGNNRVVMRKNEKSYAAKPYNMPGGLKLKITGKNNTINIHHPISFERSYILLECDDSVVDIGKNCRFVKADIFCGKGSDTRINIGDNCSTEGVKIISRGAAKLIIEDDCMFAANIVIRLTDSHYVYDMGGNSVLNNQKYPARIGRHSWIGENVLMTKNVSIPPNTIIGLGSVVSGKFTEEHTCIAGNPAKIVKRNVTWAR